MTDWYPGIGDPPITTTPTSSTSSLTACFSRTFPTDADPYERPFTENVVLPAINKIEERSCLRPLVCRRYPENQTEEEDFYWWSYPPRVNDYLEAPREHGLPMREVKLSGG